jgi:hypothetical protein
MTVTGTTYWLKIDLITYRFYTPFSAIIIFGAARRA